MTKIGRVIAYENKTKMATIEYSRPDACEKCGACGTSSHKGTIKIKADCAVGDWVRLELPEARFVQAAFLAYGLPLLGFLSGLFLGSWLWHSDGGSILGAVLGLLLALGILALNERRIRHRPDWSAQVQQIYDEKPTLEDLGCSSPTA